MPKGSAKGEVKEGEKKMSKEEQEFKDGEKKTPELAAFLVTMDPEGENDNEAVCTPPLFLHV